MVPGAGLLRLAGEPARDPRRDQGTLRTAWFRLEWCRAVTAVSDGVPDTACAEVRFFFDYWLGLKGKDHLPAADHVDPLDFFSHLSRVFIVEGRDLDSLIIRVAGTVYRDLYGFEITGRRVVELIPFGNRRDLLVDYTRCIRDRVPVFHAGRMTWRDRGSQVSYERILLPFGSDNAVEKILGFAQFFDSEGNKLFK